MRRAEQNARTGDALTKNIHFNLARTHIRMKSFQFEVINDRALDINEMKRMFQNLETNETNFETKALSHREICKYKYKTQNTNKNK